MSTQIEEARQVLKNARRELHRKPNVVATGIGYKITNGKKTDQLAVICSVQSKRKKSKLMKNELVPQEVDGIPTDVFPSGLFHILADHKVRYRPAPGGVSIGHLEITAGTLGCLVQKNGKVYILSNNHVLANSNDGEIGDPILQPGPNDGGSYPEDHIANLSEFVPIVFQDDLGGEDSTCPIGNTVGRVLNTMAAMVGSRTRMRAVRIEAESAENLVDCALAEPLNVNDVKNEIMEIGKINGLAEGELGMNVKKSGRTTALTTGVIEQIDVTVSINYGQNRVAVFVDQLMTGNMSAGGDSGSAVLDNDNRLVGLLFAGSNTSTIINRIQNVFSALQVSLIS